MFDDYPKKIILKDNTECIFTIADGTTISDVLDLFPRINKDDLWVLPRDYTRREAMDFFIRSFNPEENVHILAKVNNLLVGLGSLYYTRFGARKHIGKVEVLIDETYKKKRLGTWLILELVSIAQMLKLELLEIHLVAGKDDAAITAAKRINFIPQATLKNYLQDRNGRWMDLIILLKEIHESWSDY
ncbi:MAG: GNAT family N-acetyltransferase [Spirochaetes bacterium]|nr:GNAT family N-acetyltransferase [Spirochaetota bacterium]